MRIMRGMANGQQHIDDTSGAEASRTAQVPERPDAIHYGAQTRRVLERLQGTIATDSGGRLELQLVPDPAAIDAVARPLHNPPEAQQTMFQ